MPDKDITLGEVYRAVLSLRDEVHAIRTEFTESQQRLRDDNIRFGLNIKEHEVRIEMLEVRMKEYDRLKTEIRTANETLGLRVQTIENAGASRNADPWARVGSVLSALAAGAAAWFAKG